MRYRLRAPDGTLHEGDDLAEFAREQELDYSNLTRIIRGTRRQYKGWVVDLREDPMVTIRMRVGAGALVMRPEQAVGGTGRLLFSADGRTHAVKGRIVSVTVDETPE